MMENPSARRDSVLQMRAWAYPRKFSLLVRLQSPKSIQHGDLWAHEALVVDFTVGQRLEDLEHITAVPLKDQT